MIFKSYIIENDIQNTKKNLNLFFGENLGLKQDFKKKIKESFKRCEFLNFYQDDIIKNNNILFNEINNISLFENEKIILIEQASDKILEVIEEISTKNKEQKVYLFAEWLDKKSKLRDFFEKSEDCAAIACYDDNEIAIKKIIQNKLGGFEGLSSYNVNLIINNCNLDRVKLKNELEKISTFFNNKIIETEKLEILLNNKISEDFNKLRDEALNGDKTKTNKLLSETQIENEKDIYYLNIINQRLIRLLELYKEDSGKTNIVSKINKLKPPIFWKDKENFAKQALKWSKKKVNYALENNYNLEIKLKSNSSISKNILIKKLMVDLCNLANA